MINIINMPLVAKGPGLSCVVVPKSNSQEFHSILKLYHSWNVENMPVFMFHYLLTWLRTGPEPFPLGWGRFPISEGWWICIYCIQGALHSKNGDISGSSDDSSVILFMLILYDTMWSFHLAKLSAVSLFKPHQHFQEELCDKHAGVSQLSFPLHRGITKVESIRSSLKKKHVYYEEALVPVQASRQTYTELTPNSTHTSSVCGWPVCFGI